MQPGEGLGCLLHDGSQGRNAEHVLERGDAGHGCVLRRANLLHIEVGDLRLALHHPLVQVLAEFGQLLDRLRLFHKSLVHAPAPRSTGLPAVLELLAFEVSSAQTVEVGLQACDVILNDGVVLTLDGGADLADAGTGVQHLHHGLGGGDTASGHDSEAWGEALNGPDRTSGKRSVDVTSNATTGKQLVGSDLGPPLPFGIKIHHPRHGVHNSDSISPPSLDGLSDDRNLRNGIAELHKNRNFAPVRSDAGVLAPPCDLLDNGGILPACQTHASFSHPVRA
mmetsp:Transcript_10167/g.24230  ORF Transcript_10167/g.24230 Transcript_10167/m.24230 type:complete len:280 (+) Transcript_10167:404-1243(+)